MLRKLLLAVVVLALIGGSLSCIASKSNVPGKYVCTQASQAKGVTASDFDKGDILELKEDGTIYWHSPGQPGVTGNWKIDGSEILLSTEFFGMTWKGDIKGDTISLEDGSIWVKEKESATKPTSPMPTTEKATSTPTSPEVTTPLPPGTTGVGDFTVALSSVEREESVTTLLFAITKAGDGSSGHQSVPIILIDDHENKYTGNLGVDLENAPDAVLNDLPKGFTYVDKVDISMPKAAPIVKVKLGERELFYKDFEFSQPQLLTDFGDLAITKGQSVPLGKWLSFVIEQAVPEIPTWKLPVTIENKDYSSLPAEVRLGVQNRDGTISWGSSITKDVPATSKTSVNMPLVFQEIPPQPRVLMLQYIDKKAQEHVLKVFPMPPGKLLPFPIVSEKIYEKWKEDGFALGLPVENEQSARVSGDQGSIASGRYQSFERGRIYAITSGAGVDQVVAISGTAYSEYSRLSFEASWLGFPISRYASPETSYDQYDFEGGYLATTDEKTFRAFPYEQGKITFVSDRDDNREIYVTDTSGRNQINLTRHPSADTAPAWSPDGTRIAFVSDRSPQGIYVMNADGSNQTFLTKGLCPTWSPDGLHIAFRSGTGRSGEIYVINANGSSVRRLTYNDTQEGDIAWSPDGSRIAFVSVQDLNWRLCVIDIDGSNQTYITTGFTENPSWSPDGSRITFTYTQKGNWEIYVMDADGSNQLNITNNPAEDYHPAWSPDGSHIAFVSGRDGNREIYIMDVDNSNVTRLTYDSAADWYPAWSPDGRYIVFSSHRDGNPEIYVMDADGSNQTRLTYNYSTSAISPTWGCVR